MTSDSCSLEGTLLELEPPKKCYKIRRAVEEDNDDLVEIINLYSKNLQELYGNFFVSELLNYPNRQIIVAEFEGLAVALLMVSETINSFLLKEEFELQPYNNLRKPCLRQSLAKYTSLCPTMSFESPPVKVIFEENFAESLLGSASSEDFIVVLNNSHLEGVLGEGIDDLSDEWLKEDFSVTLTRTNYYKKFLLEEKDSLMSHGNISFLEDLKQDFLEGNVFVLELVASRPQHLPILEVLFKAMFSCFPKREYCIISQPSELSPNLFNKWFSKVPPKPGSHFPDELYIMSKSSFTGNLTVTKALETHEAQIRTLCKTLEDFDGILGKFLKKPSLFKIFVMLSQETVVGLAILTEKFDFKHIKEIFFLENLDASGIIDTCILANQFLIHSSYFLQKLHEISGFKVLLYKLESSGSLNCNLLGFLTPVKPRVFEDDYQTNLVNPALFWSSLNSCGRQRIEINHKIVVVGSSLTALSFIENLIFPGENQDSLIVFNNITWIDNRKFYKQNTRDFLIRRTLKTYKVLYTMYFRTFVNTINGCLIAINRKEKFITINENSNIYYDFLILMSGLEFLLPNQEEDCPNNVFVMNSPADSCKIASLKQDQIDIIIYGYCLEAQAFTSLLMSRGISGKNISLIQPFPNNILLEKKNQQNIPLFEDSQVEDTIKKSFKHTGVRIITSSFLVGWNLNKNKITSCKFESLNRLFELPCSVLFIFDEVGVSFKTFNAIVEAGLIFDEGLVVQDDYKTHDPSIFAAGTLTRHKQNYFLHQKFVNQEEVGLEVSKIIKDLLGVKPQNFCEGFYKEPLIASCKLGGDLKYFSVTKPGLQVPYSVARTRDNFGVELKTGSCVNLEHQNFFKLYLNKMGQVESIFCLSKRKIEEKKLLKLYGKEVLGEVLSEFNAGLIEDLYEYFQ